MVVRSRLNAASRPILPDDLSKFNPNDGALVVMRLSLRIRLLGYLVIWATFQLATPAFAQDVEALVRQLGAGSFSDKIATVEQLGQLGDDRAVPALEALIERKLYTTKADGQLVIADKHGKVYDLVDPVTGEKLGEAKSRDIKRIRVNNRLRGAVHGVLGGLTLFSPDPDRRWRAADQVFNAPSADLIGILEQAIERENHGDLRDHMGRALAATQLLTLKDTQTRVAAIEDLSEYAEPDVRSLLSGLLVLNADGTFAEPDETVRAAAELAVSDIKDRLALWGMVNQVFHGLSLGSVLALVAVGLAITFGVMGVINLAHGELVMLGAYTTFVIQEIFRTHLPAGLDYALFIAIPGAFVVAGAFGILIERTVIRFLYGRPLETLLATWGISLILQQLVRTVFGPTNRNVSNPSWMSGAIETSQGLVLTYNRIWIIVFSLLVFALLGLLLRKTLFGLHMRAVTQNRPMAASMGIRTDRVDALTFGLGSGIAGVAGVALSQIDNVSPNLGQAYIVDSFMVVVFGGVGNLWGTLVGGFSIGLLNKFLEPFAGAVLGKILVLVAIILFIQKRPRGLFALKGRAVDA